MNRKLTALVTAVLAGSLILSSCSEDKPTAQTQGQAQTEQAFAQQSQAVPYPADQLKDSLERRNIRERLLRTNNPSRIGYVYLISFSKPLGYYVIKGKVSSTQSQMTTDQFVERHTDTGGGNLAYNAPGDDGSYGANEDGVFFFTTEGAMVTTTLDFVYSDQPIPFSVPKLNKAA
jgi:hypothetical protein